MHETKCTKIYVKLFELVEIELKFQITPQYCSHQDELFLFKSIAQCIACVCILLGLQFYSIIICSICLYKANFGSISCYFNASYFISSSISNFDLFIWTPALRNEFSIPFWSEWKNNSICNLYFFSIFHQILSTNIRWAHESIF